MDLPPFPDVRGLTVFPGMESNTLEFKQSLSNIIKNKCISTICAFLNSKGGYIVFGVEDVDRKIIGIDATPMEMDQHLRWFDHMYHSKRITDGDGNMLNPGTLEAKIVNVSDDKFILVLKIKPESGQTYKCLDGTTWHRLAASVYCFQEGSAEKELIIMQEKINLEKKRAKYALNEAHQVRNDMKRIISLAKELDLQFENFTNSVWCTILEKKKAKENELRCQKSLCTFIFNLFM